MDKRKVVAIVLIAVAAIVYGVSPIDVIPDFLGPLGIADDAVAGIAAVAGIIATLLSGRKRPGGATGPAGANPGVPGE
ncbi:MAG: DUF1232 domain-containing protein [Actinomycetales bacterium]|nr:DUF1232 domain-containing protein [Actinomycetales bacterium]